MDAPSPSSFNFVKGVILLSFAAMTKTSGLESYDTLIELIKVHPPTFTSFWEIVAAISNELS